MAPGDSCAWLSVRTPAACAGSPAEALDGVWSGSVRLEATSAHALSWQVSRRADGGFLGYVLAGGSSRAIVASASCGDTLYVGLTEGPASSPRTWCIEASLASPTHLFGTATDGEVTRSISLDRRADGAAPLREHRFLFWRGTTLADATSEMGATELAVAVDPDLVLSAFGSFVSLAGDPAWAPYGDVVSFSQSAVDTGVDTATTLRFGLETEDPCPGTGALLASFDPSTGLYSGSFTFTDCEQHTATGPVIGKRAQRTTSADVAGMLQTLAAYADAMEQGDTGALPSLFSQAYLHDHVDTAGRLTLLGQELAAYEERRLLPYRIRSAVTVPDPYTLPQLELPVQIQFSDYREGVPAGTNQWVTYRDSDTSEAGEDELRFFREEDGQWRFFGNQVGPAVPVIADAGADVAEEDGVGDDAFDASEDADSGEPGDASLDEPAEMDEGGPSCQSSDCSTCIHTGCVSIVQSNPVAPSAEFTAFAQCICGDPATDISPGGAACLPLLDSLDPIWVAYASCIIDSCSTACGLGFQVDAGSDGALSGDATPDAVEGGDVSDGGGEPDVDAEPPAPVCGNGIVELGEACDPPGGATDLFCTACGVVDRLASFPIAVPDGAPRPGRLLGDGRHPLAGGDSPGAVWLGTSSSVPEIWLAGVPHPAGPSAVKVSDGAFRTSPSIPLATSDPVVAALGVGSFVVAWTEFGGDGDELGIALRRYDATLHLLPGIHANRGTALNQRDPDVLWTGSQLVVAWTDDSELATGEDVVYRTFDRYLAPTSDDVRLAATPASEGLVALAPFGAGWAAAWRAAAGGTEHVWVRAAGQSFDIGEQLPGPSRQRPALAQLDATHLLVAFAVGPDAAAGTVVSRVRLAVVDVTRASPVSLLELPQALTLAPGGDGLAQDEPNLQLVGDGVWLAWRTDAIPGDANHEELWTKKVAAGGVILSGTSEAPLPRVEAHRAGDQRRAALAAVAVGEVNGLAALWEDYGGALGASAGAPDLVMTRWSPVP